MKLEKDKEAVEKVIYYENKQKEREKIREQMNEREEKRIKEFLDSKIIHETRRIESENQLEEDRLKAKQNNALKRFDREETVQRIQRMRDYQTQQLLLKIQMDNEKAERVKQKRAELLDQRKLINQQIVKEKEEVMKKFEKLKFTGDIPKEFQDIAGMSDNTGGSIQKDSNKLNKSAELPKNE